MSLILDGGNGVTFPNGSNPQAAPSKVLQVVQFSGNGITGTTSTSYVSTALAATITPLFSTSKILIMVSTTGTNTSQNTFFTIYKNNTTNLGGGSQNCFTAYLYNSGTTSLWIPVNMTYLDSPATTSATTYGMYIKVSGATGYGSLDQALNTITLMEIAA